MRIRSTKPEFWRSKTIAQLDWATRLVLKGLESYVDDNGVGKDDLALIAADVFPRDLSANPPDTLARLSEAISVIADMGLIARYEVDGEDLLYIDKWKDLQRIDKPGKGRFPRPDGTTEYLQEVNRESYRSPRETVASPPEVVAPVTGEQGNRGTGAKGTEEQVLAPQAAPKTQRGTRLPQGWNPDDDVIRSMREERPDVDLRLEHKKFTDHFKAKAGRDGVKLDWNATWRNWIRNARPTPNMPSTGMSAADTKVNDWLALANQQQPHLKAIGND